MRLKQSQVLSSLPTTHSPHTLVLSDSHYSTHIYLTNRYVIMATVIPNIKKFVYYIDRVISTAILFYSRVCISYIQTRSNINRPILFLTITYDILCLQEVLKIINITSVVLIPRVMQVFVFSYDTLMMVAEATETCR